MSNKITFKDTVLGVGDKIKVVQKVTEQGKDRRQVFIGTLIKIKGETEEKTITVRRIGANLIGIERVFPLNNPYIEEITVQKEGLLGARRSKLYFIRSKSKRDIEKIYKRAKTRSSEKK